MNPLALAKRYFDLSNQSDLAAIRELMTDSTTYSSDNAGVFLGVCPIPTLIAAGVFALVVIVTRMVSAGSILGALTFAAAVYVLPHDWAIRTIASLIAVLIVARHRTNIQRILGGQENRL